MKKIKYIRMLLLLFLLSLTVSSCYTQLALTYPGRPEQQDEVYYVEEDTFYTDDNEEYVMQYDIYPETYNNYYWSYDPWCHWNGYYYYDYAYWPYPPYHWYRPWVFVYYPYYPDYGWGYWPGRTTYTPNPRPFVKDGIASRNGGSSRVRLGSANSNDYGSRATRLTAKASDTHRKTSVRKTRDRNSGTEDRYATKAVRTTVRNTNTNSYPVTVTTEGSKTSRKVSDRSGRKYYPIRTASGNRTVRKVTKISPAKSSSGNKRVSSSSGKSRSPRSSSTGKSYSGKSSSSGRSVSSSRNTSSNRGSGSVSRSSSSNRSSGSGSVSRSSSGSSRGSSSRSSSKSSGSRRR